MLKSRTCWFSLWSFFISAGLIRGEVRVDLQYTRFYTDSTLQSIQSLAIWKITKSKKGKKMEKRKEKKSFKGSARVSATAAGHAFTPPASVTRISAVGTAHKTSRHRREKPASHVERSFHIFFKTEIKFSRFSGGKCWKTQRFPQAMKGTVWRNWPDALWLYVFRQGIVFCVMTCQGGDTNRQSMRTRGADSMSAMEWKLSSTWWKDSLIVATQGRRSFFKDEESHLLCLSRFSPTMEDKQCQALDIALRPECFEEKKKDNAFQHNYSQLCLQSPGGSCSAVWFLLCLLLVHLLWCEWFGRWCNSGPGIPLNSEKTEFHPITINSGKANVEHFIGWFHKSPTVDRSSRDSTALSMRKKNDE